MRDFSYLGSIAIEIGSDCNLKKVHDVCPANQLKRNDNNILSIEEICVIMDEAVDNNFKGLFAFHFYNEPLMYINRISEIVHKRPQYRYLLWSNGLLVNKVRESGFDFSLFEKIVFTCYDEKYRDMLELLKTVHKNVQIFVPDMDNRLNIYSEDERKQFSCKKMSIELPIDCEGNVYICTFDYGKQYLLGNIRDSSLISIINSEKYKQYYDAQSKLLMGETACSLCKKCRRVCRESII